MSKSFDLGKVSQDFSLENQHGSYSDLFYTVTFDEPVCGMFDICASDDPEELGLSYAIFDCEGNSLSDNGGFLEAGTYTIQVNADESVKFKVAFEYAKDLGTVTDTASIDISHPGYSIPI